MKNQGYLRSFKAICIITFVLFSSSIYCQAPELGTASGFAVFTAVGAFNSLDETRIIGDAGTNVGEFNGFPPGDVQGQINIADAISAQAAIDVDNAYKELLAVECGVVLGTTMGSGQILTPAVYCLGAASTLSGDLTFDAQGNKEAIFIVKINGAFATSTFTNVILINSALASNIYWQVNGQFTMGENSVFKGTVIADGAIVLLKSTTIEGRLLSRAGAISLDLSIVTLSNEEVLLPVELITFFVECNDMEATLCWSTASENGNKDFTVECSVDGINYEGIGVLNGSGNTSTNTNYSFTHDNPYHSKSYYRLKQTDFDGSFEYSWIIPLTSCLKSIPELDVFPNPVKNTLFLSFAGDVEQTISIIVYSSVGQIVYYSDKYKTELDLSDNSNGIYYVHFNHATGIITKRIVLAAQTIP